MFRMLRGCGAAALESAERQMRGGGLGLSTARWLNGQAGNEGQDVTSSRGGGERAVGGEEYRIYTWGRSKSGALGHERELEAPHVVEGFPGGPSFYGEQPQLQCGLFHTAALQGSELYTWGRGEGGRLGLGDEVSAHAPQLVEPHDGGWKSVHLGGLHSAAVTEEGALLTWGYGAFGALGYGLWDRRLEPRLVLRVWDGEEVPTPEEPSVDDMPGWLSFLVGGEATAQASKESSGAKVVQASQPFVEVVHAAPAVACGGAHSLFLTREGGLWAAGRDEGEGRLGCLRDQQLLQEKGSPFPRLVLLPEPAAWAVAGGFCSFAMTVDGDLWAWGGNANGELGTGSGFAQHTAPARLEALQRSSIASMAAGGVHAVALDVEGGVWTWGAGQDGQLGRGRLASTALPARVEALRGERIAQVACGSRSSFAVTHDGRLLAWGNNFDGQMACCSRSDRVSEPLQIDGLPPVVSVAAGAAHVAVVCRVEAAAV